MKIIGASLVALLVSTASALAEVPNVVATIKPVHSLVSAVMGDLGAPTLLVKGGASPHTYSLRPSDAAALEAADLVFWTGHGMELFLGEALETLAGGATAVELAEAPGIALLPVREGGAFEPHEDEAGEEHDPDEDEHDHAHEGEADMHFWLDPDNAALMLKAIAEALSAADPEHAATYVANAATETAAIVAEAAKIDALLAPVRETPFVVFHDAYQYFERRFDLAVAGSVTVTPDTMPGAQRVRALNAKVRELGAACVFSEPQFEPAIISAIVEGTPARTGVLDPEGAGLAEGPELYRGLLGGLATSIHDCLSAAD